MASGRYIEGILDVRYIENYRNTDAMEIMTQRYTLKMRYNNRDIILK